MAPNPSPSLLVVEDDPAARNIIANMIDIRFRGCSIYTADNGRQGLELFRQHTPQIVITDINMPVMNGIEMARAIRALDADTNFIVLTAYGDERFRRSFSELGFHSFLMKPIDFKELFASIEQCNAVTT